jgi:cysteine-S-conjugate beta-lyase
MSTHPFDAITAEQLSAPHSRKWSLHPGTIGAWVAEMDFGTAPVITAALHDAVTRGDLGYLAPATTRRMQDATAAYHRDRYGWEIPPERVHPVSDVMSALAVVLDKFAPGHGPLIVPTPAYMPFLSFPPTIGHDVIEVPSRRVGGRWLMDLDGIDEAFRRGGRTLVLCNPHNPTGTVFTRDELLAVAAIVERHNGRVFSDEIHAPLTFGAARHIPYASVSDEAARHALTATSASKAFNIPGLKTAQLITSNDADEELYQVFGFTVVHGASTPGVIANAVAYETGGPWLEDVVDYLDGNRRLLGQLLAEHAPGVGYTAPDATYIAWLDLSGYPIDGPVGDFLRESAGIAVTDGALCGTGYERYARLVFAMPRPVLERTVIQLADALRAL